MKHIPVHITNVVTHVQSLVLAILCWCYLHIRVASALEQFNCSPFSFRRPRTACVSVLFFSFSVCSRELVSQQSRMGFTRQKRMTNEINKTNIHQQNSVPVFFIHSNLSSHRKFITRNEMGFLCSDFFV